jgi:hypothetical protein
MASPGFGLVAYAFGRRSGAVLTGIQPSVRTTRRRRDFPARDRPERGRRPAGGGRPDRAAGGGRPTGADRSPWSGSCHREKAGACGFSFGRPQSSLRPRGPHPRPPPRRGVPAPTPRRAGVPDGRPAEAGGDHGYRDVFSARPNCARESAGRRAEAGEPKGWEPGSFIPISRVIGPIGLLAITRRAADRAGARSARGAMGGGARRAGARGTRQARRARADATGRGVPGAERGAIGRGCETRAGAGRGRAGMYGRCKGTGGRGSAGERRARRARGHGRVQGHRRARKCGEA